jgi:DNA/RNA endonuclease G (NUC1)
MGSLERLSKWYFNTENMAYSNSTYSNCAVSVDKIEAWTGFDFFANLPDNIENVAETNSSWSNF